MKNIHQLFLLLTFLFVMATTGFSQSNQPYDPSLDGKLQLGNAVQQAKAEGKHVLVMIGGNW